jgi:hypothetical protein
MSHAVRDISFCKGRNFEHLALVGLKPNLKGRFLLEIHRVTKYLNQPWINRLQGCEKGQSGAQREDYVNRMTLMFQN